MKREGDAPASTKPNDPPLPPSTSPGAAPRIKRVVPRPSEATLAAAAADVSDAAQVKGRDTVPQSNGGDALSREKERGGCEGNVLSKSARRRRNRRRQRQPVVQDDKEAQGMPCPKGDRAAQAPVESRRAPRIKRVVPQHPHATGGREISDDHDVAAAPAADIGSAPLPDDGTGNVGGGPAGPTDREATRRALRQRIQSRGRSRTSAFALRCATTANECSGEPNPGPAPLQLDRGQKRRLARAARSGQLGDPSSINVDGVLASLGVNNPAVRDIVHRAVGAGLGPQIPRE